ncbi:MAG: hypothetical protein IKV25_01055 [Clostridia bacterium]|nr:hypothetical protein [Clostridia bacterium]
MKTKITLHSELVYILSIFILSFSVAMVSAADFGLSMIVSPAFILSQKLGFLTFGQSEYVVQALLFVVLCILMKRVKLIYFSSFITCLIYGAILDLWRAVIPMFNPTITEAGSMGMPLRVTFFAVGTLITTLAIAMCFRTYLYPQVYDFFVKGVTEKFNLDRTKFKIGFDIVFLIVSCAMTLIFFGGFVGIGVGTLITALVNGFLIGNFGKLFDKLFEVKPLFPKLAKKFDI